MRRSKYLRIRVDLVLELHESVESLPIGSEAPEYVTKATAEAAYELLPDHLKARGYSALLHGARLRANLTTKPR